jgi:hypothetical protein
MQDEKDVTEELPREEVQKAIRLLTDREPPPNYDPAGMSESEITEVILCNAGYIRASEEWLETLARVLDPDAETDKLETMLHERIRECTAVIAKIQKAS